MTTSSNGHTVFGAIEGKWKALGAERSALGLPTSNEAPTFDGVGRSQTFQGGTISWHPEIGAFEIHGSIHARWRDMGAEQYGYPITDESPCPDGHGRFNHFRALHINGHPEASIYWTPETQAQPIFGAIRARWASLGWERSSLGYPVGGEAPTFDGRGRNQPFQGGAMSWHPDIGPFVVQGQICAKWREIGAEQYGYPITDECPCPDGRGRFNHFRAMHLEGRPESSVYWTPDTGAWPVYGAIRDRWAHRGWETSNLGYPTGAEDNWPEGAGRQQRFQHGRIVWSPTGGALFDPLVLSAPISSGGLAALGGWINVIVDAAGNVQWKGHAHDSGADGYQFNISAVVQTPNGVGVAFGHGGRVGGTFTAGSRDHDWNEPSPQPPFVSVQDLNNGVLHTQINYTSDIGSTLEDLVSWAVKWSVGSALGELSALVFIGAEIGSLIATGSLVPGARIVEGVLWMAGPANTLVAVAAGGIASLGSRTRELSQAEYDWANEAVFLGSLPARDRIVLTDTLGGDGNAFTFPRFDGKITLNMGPTAYDDPRKYKGESGKRLGYTFIHELVHACQIEHSSSANLAYLGRALAAKACDVVGDAYAYGPAGGDYTSFGMEAQAQIICDWYAGVNSHGATDQSGKPMDPNSPYFRYVQDVRQGRF